jgi:hypothetical protein
MSDVKEAIEIETQIAHCIRPSKSNRFRSRLLVDVQPDEPVDVPQVHDDVVRHRGEREGAAERTDRSLVVFGLAEDLG